MAHTELPCGTECSRPENKLSSDFVSLLVFKENRKLKRGEVKKLPVESEQQHYVIPFSPHTPYFQRSRKCDICFE